MGRNGNGISRLVRIRYDRNPQALLMRGLTGIPHFRDTLSLQVMLSMSLSYDLALLGLVPHLYLGTFIHAQEFSPQHCLEVKERKNTNTHQP